MTDEPVSGTLFGFTVHYSVAQVAEMWGLSENTIRRIFEKEPDVLKMAEGREGRRGIRRIRRIRRTLRIPAFVVERVHKRMSTSSAA